MLTLTQLRKIDPSLAHVPNERLEAIRAELYGAAQLAFDSWLSVKTDSKCPLGLLTPELKADSISI